MKIYNVLWRDRHSDTTVTSFLDLNEAKVWAKEQAESVCRFQEDIKEIFTKEWLYCLEYSCEGDCLWIIERDIGRMDKKEENI
jgi:hypothetical protein